ncbi:acyltransferase [Candidatus Kaiserbacteria bacterium]|nr:acyltransferase [Candidatus Kaiserbacteria bacterium]
MVERKLRDRFHKWKRPTIKHGILTKWLWVVFHPENLKLGKRTDIGAFTAIFAHEGIEIGENVQIGSHCSIYSVNTIDNTKGRVKIGKNACIGSHTTIMPGVTIGVGALIGAHSFVKIDVPPGAVAYGVPTKVMRKK